MGVRWPSLAKPEVGELFFRDNTLVKVVCISIYLNVLISMKYNIVHIRHL